MKINDIVKAFDVLDKFEFFGGQRAGRELWFDKPADIQDEDIKQFVDDVHFLKNFINRQKAEIADLKAKKEICAEVITRQNNEIDKLSKVVDNYESCLKCVEVIRANAIKEFAERLKNKFYSYYEGLDENTSKSKYNGETLMYYEVADMIENCIDNTVKELTEGQNES